MTTIDVGVIGVIYNHDVYKYKYDDEIFEFTFEDTQTVFIWVRYGKIQHSCNE